MSTSRARHLLAAVTVVGMLAAGCGSTPAVAAGSVPKLAAPADDTGGGGSGAGRHGGRAPVAPAAASLPVDVPLPAYGIQSSSLSPGRWGFLMSTHGQADQVLASITAFYISAGFTAVNSASLTRAPYTVSITAENHDHTDTTAASVSILVTSG